MTQAKTRTLKVAILDDYQNVALAMADWSLAGAGVETVAFHDHVSDRHRLAARLAPFDVVVVIRERTLFDAAMIGLLPNLKMIGSIGMVNAAIDLEAAAARGIVVCGTEPHHANGTPALTWALILASMRHLCAEAASVKAGGWQINVGSDTAGKVLGLLGLGKIGQAVARVGLAFGMNVIAWSQNLTTAMAEAHGVERVEKEALFRRSDVLSVHLRLSARTHGIIAAAELALMKPTALLVNTSRGPLVAEPDLIAALRDRRIGGAALDVFDHEPLPPDHAFRHLPNVLATPHIGYVTENTYRDAFPQIVEDIAAWVGGKPIRVMRS